MNCRRVERLLSDHLEGLLSKRETAAVSAHLLDCPACRQLRNRITDAAGALRELPAPIPSPELRRRALDAWTSGQTAPLFGGQRWIAVPKDLDGRLRLAIAALLLGALGVTVVHRERPSPRDGRLLVGLSDVSSRNVPEGTLQGESAKL